MQLSMEKDKILIGIIIFLLVIIIGGIGFIQSTKADSGLNINPPENDNEETHNINTEEYVYVHVSGHVRTPGVYKLPEGSRVHQAIELAGGPTEEGDLERLNLAQVLQDGQKITVPNINSDPQDINDPWEENDGTNTGKININTASKEALETLTGIGPAKANAIIDHRQKNGPFSRIEDIEKVPGIGPATFNQIKDNITVR